MSLFIGIQEAYLILPLYFHPFCLGTYYVLRALYVTLYLILPTTCVFVNEKVEFKWLTQDDAAVSHQCPDQNPDFNRSFALPGSLGSCGFLNNLVLYLYLCYSIGC